MVDTQHLEKMISEKGIKKTFIASKLGCTIQTLRRKLLGLSDFTMEEVNILCEILHIASLSDKEKIFNQKVDKTST